MKLEFSSFSLFVGLLVSLIIAAVVATAITWSWYFLFLFPAFATVWLLGAVVLAINDWFFDKNHPFVK